MYVLVTSNIKLAFKTDLEELFIGFLKRKKPMFASLVYPCERLNEKIAFLFLLSYKLKGQ